MSIFFEGYLISVRRKNVKGSKNLNPELFDETNSILKVLHDGMKKQHNQLISIDLLLRCARLDDINLDQQNLSCFLEIGEHGKAHSIYDVESGKKTHDKTITEAGLEPTYFSINFPVGKKTGIMLCLRSGQSGAKVFAENLLHNTFEATHPKFKLHIEPLMPRSALDTLLKKSKLNSVHFTKGIVSADFADKFNVKKGPQEGEVEIVIRPKGRGFLQMNSLFELIFPSQSGHGLSHF